MRKVLITESSLRDLLRELMNSHAPIFPNPVVDPQAAETDPTNQNFVPSDKIELMSAIRALIDPIDDERVPQVYVAVKDAVEKEEAEMKDTQVESIVRRAVRKILKETLLNEETAAEKRARFAQIAHSKPVFMSVSKSEAERLGIKYDIKNVSGEMVKVDLSLLNPEEKSKLIAANRETGKFSKVAGPGESDKSLSKEEFIKRSNEIREKLEKLDFLSDAKDEEKKELVSSIVGSPKSFDVITDEDVQRFFNAYKLTEDQLEDEILSTGKELSLEPSQIINSKLFNENFGQNFNQFAEKKGKAVLASLEKKGYFKGANSNLKAIGKELNLSVSGVKKLSNIAIGKFAIAGKAILKFEDFLNEPSVDLEPSAWDPE